MRIGSSVAVALGVSLGVLVAGVGSARASWEHLVDLFASSGTSVSRPALASLQNGTQVDRLDPQMQAESLLELAIGNTEGANEQIAARVEGWRGKLSWDSQLSALTRAALNSNDLRIRQSSLEVQLAAYGLAKNPSTVEFLIHNATSSGHARKLWAMWALGALANRGIETRQVERVLLGHLKDKDADEESRRWTVEAVALVGTNATIAPLLQVMRDDPSPVVRESAACSLAESGMLSHEQRLTAVAQLVTYTEDSSLDAQTHNWAFQALGDITKERLPNDSAAWRSWYAAKNREGRMIK